MHVKACVFIATVLAFSAFVLAWSVNWKLGLALMLLSGSRNVVTATFYQRKQKPS